MSEGEATKPWHPITILAAAVLLPGVGHVLNGLPQRGLMFLFFIIVLGWATVRIAGPEMTFVGQHIGGIFVYGLSVIDAYKAARVRWEMWSHSRREAGGG